MAENLSHSDTLAEYIHNVLPVYHDKYFEFQIQQETETVRAVCFSPKERKQFAAYDHNKSPVKIKKFKIDTTSNAKDVLVGDDVSVEDCPNINFQKSELPSTMNIAVATRRSFRSYNRAFKIKLFLALESQCSVRVHFFAF